MAPFKFRKNKKKDTADDSQANVSMSSQSTTNSLPSATNNNNGGYQYSQSPSYTQPQPAKFSPVAPADPPQQQARQLGKLGSPSFSTPNPNSHNSLPSQNVTPNPNLYHTNSPSSLHYTPQQHFPITPQQQNMRMKSNFTTPWKKHKLFNSPFPRYRHAASTISSDKNEIFVMGGLKDGSVFGDTWIIEPVETSSGEVSYTARSVDVVSNTPPERVGHSSVLCGNAYIIFGGDTVDTDDNGYPDDNFYLFNTNNARYTLPDHILNRPKGRYGHTIGVIAFTSNSSRLYLFGGQLENEVFNDLHYFELTSFKNPRASWAEVSPIDGIKPPPLTNHSMVIYKNKLFIFGGVYENKQVTNDLWCFDPAVNKWTQIQTTGAIPPPTNEHSACIVLDQMYIYGGNDFNGVLYESLYVLNMRTFTWSKLPSNLLDNPGPRCGHSMTYVTLLKKLVIMGGDKKDFVSEDPDDFETHEDGDSESAIGTMIYELDLSKVDFFLASPSLDRNASDGSSNHEKSVLANTSPSRTDRQITGHTMESPFHSVDQKSQVDTHVPVASFENFNNSLRDEQPVNKSLGGFEEEEEEEVSIFEASTPLKSKEMMHNLNEKPLPQLELHAPSKTPQNEDMKLKSNFDDEFKTPSSTPTNIAPVINAKSNVGLSHSILDLETIEFEKRANPEFVDMEDMESEAKDDDDEDDHRATQNLSDRGVASGFQGTHASFLDNYTYRDSQATDFDALLDKDDTIPIVQPEIENSEKSLQLIQGDASVRAMISSITDELNNLRLQAKEQMVTASEKISKLEQENKELKSQHESEISNLKSKIEEKSIVSPTLENKEQILETEEVQNKEIVPDLADSATNTKDLNAFRRDNLELSSKLLVLENEKKEMNDELNKLKPFITSKITELDGYNNIIKVQNAKINTLSESLKGSELLEKELNDLKHKYADLTVELKNHRAIYGTDVNESTDEEEVNGETPRFVDFIQSTDSMSQHLEKLITLWHNPSNSSDSKEVNGELAEETSGGSIVTQLQNHIQELLSINKQQEESHDRAISDVSDLKSRVEQLHGENTKLSSLKSYEDNYRNALQSVKNTSKALDLTQNELSKQKDINVKLQKEIEELKLYRASRRASSRTHTPIIHNIQEDQNSDEAAANSDDEEEDIKNAHYDMKIRDLQADLIIIKQERDQLKDNVVSLKKQLLRSIPGSEY